MREWIVQAGHSAAFVFKLRRNIALEGDLALAERELRAFLPGKLEPVTDLAALAVDWPELANLPGLRALGADCRAAGVQGYRAFAPIELLGELVRKLSFVSRIYAVCADSPPARDSAAQVSGVGTSRQAGDRLAIDAIAHNLLFELSDVVVRRAKSPAAVRTRMADLLATLIAGDEAAELEARQTTSHLFHGLHYYKAKFFPRMVRSTLNVGARALPGRLPRVLDPFAGSGTTLLEASLLGLPSVGYDLDPLSVLIAGAKLQALQALPIGRDQVAAGKMPALPGGPSLQGGPSLTGVRFPGWLLKNRRFTSEVASRLEAEIQDVRGLLAAAPPEQLPLYRVVVSDAISRRIRMRLLGTGVGRFSLTFSEAPLGEIARKTLSRLPRIAAAADWLKETLGLALAPAQALQGDARDLPADAGPFDLLVTSPPYLPASSGRETYAKARVLSFLALGMLEGDGVDDLVNDAVGSMDPGDLPALLTLEEQELVHWLQADELRAIKAVPTARYFEDMRASFEQMRRLLAPGATAVIVSGRQSTFYQFATREPLYVAHTARMLAQSAEVAGFEVEGLVDVQLAKANMNARPRSLDDYYETLIVLRQPETAIRPAFATRGDRAGSRASR